MNSSRADSCDNPWGTQEDETVLVADNNSLHATLLTKPCTQLTCCKWWGYWFASDQLALEPSSTYTYSTMLQRSCTLRKLVQQALLNTVPISYDATCSASVINPCRHFSNLPKDYASHRVVMPIRAARKAELNPEQPAADAQASSSTTVSPATPASALQQGAQTGKLLLASQLYKQ